MSEATYKLPIEEIESVLEGARNGLQWFLDRYPECQDGSDDEMFAAIDGALSSLRRYKETT